MTFDVTQFLQKYGSGFDETSFRGEVLPMMIQAGLGVFAGQDTKFWPVTNEKTEQVAKLNAERHAKEFNSKVVGAIRQTWYADVIGREKQPNWNNGVWEETKRPTVVKVDGKWVNTGDWALFMSQWVGDQAPVSPDMFGKKLWVHAVYEPHPDFNPVLPNKYTAQFRDGQMVLDDNGKPKPNYIRIVSEVIGETREEAEAWYAEHASSDSNSNLNEKLLKLRPESLEPTPENPNSGFSDEMWVECCKGILEDARNKVESFDGWEQIGITMSIIEEIKKLA